MKDGSELHNALRQYTGTENVYRHSLVRNFFYSDGVQYFARNAGGGAYWMLDILATEPTIKRLVLGEDEGCGFASVRLKVDSLTRKALLTVDDGNNNIKFSREIDITDCPSACKSHNDGCWLFFIEPTQVGGVVGSMMMLPSER